MKHSSKLLVFAMLTGAVAFFLASGTSSAATISPASGLDGLADDTTCTLSEAITSINDGNNTTYDECTNTGDAFGTTDTIILPANPITLTADLPGITESLTIQGQGMDVSVIDGDNGQYRMFGLHGVGTDFAIDGLTLSGFLGVPIQDNDSGLPSEVLNFSASRLEIDGTNMAVDGGSAIGINLFAFGGATRSYSFDDVYIHDLSGVADGTVAGILVGAANTTVNVTEERVTISNLSNTSAVAGTQGLNFLIGPFASMAGGTINADISNATITNISAENGSASGVAALGMTANGDANINVTIRNSTISGLDGVLLPSYPVPSSAIGAAGISVTDSQVSNISVDISNVVFAGNLHEGSPNNCEAQNLNSVAGGTGEVNVTITSTGGNLTDDSSCASYFTQPTDQNNVSGLAASLSPLADNGGYVPTMALLEDSPAVDAGLTIAGLTTDARGTSRPAGNAYDAGAYESSFSKPYDLGLSKELLTEGEIKPGDNVTYRLTVTNSGDVPVSLGDGTGRGVYDIAPPNLEFVAGGGQGSATCEANQSLNVFLEIAAPDHMDHQVISCDYGSTDIVLAPGVSTALDLTFRVNSLPKSGFTNYALLVDQSGKDADFASLSLLGQQAGFDMLNLVDDGTLAGNNNVASASYLSADGQLADSGQSLVLGLAVLPVSIGLGFMVRRKAVYRHAR